MLLESGTYGLAQQRVATNFPFVKNSIFVKHNKVKRNKTRYACFILLSHLGYVNPFHPKKTCDRVHQYYKMSALKIMKMKLKINFKLKAAYEVYMFL